MHRSGHCSTDVWAPGLDFSASREPMWARSVVQPKGRRSTLGVPLSLQGLALASYVIGKCVLTGLNWGDAELAQETPSARARASLALTGR